MTLKDFKLQNFFTVKNSINYNGAIKLSFKFLSLFVFDINERDLTFLKSKTTIKIKIIVSFCTLI